MIISTPEGINAYRLLSIKAALSLELKGLRHSRGSVFNLTGWELHHVKMIRDLLISLNIRYTVTSGSCYIYWFDNDGFEIRTDKVTPEGHWYTTNADSNDEGYTKLLTYANWLLG